VNAAEIIVAGARLWLWAGAAVAAVFLTIGIERIDADARGSYFFRPLLIPAVLLIWPLVLWRWWLLETGRDQWARRHRPPRAAHFRVALALAVVIPATLVTGLAIRQDAPVDIAPVQLAPPKAEE
jgi:hypothetical protein